MAKTACHCFLSGIVQGVGMRFSVKQVAKEIDISGGYVRNLPDGRVEVYAEGDEDRLQEFVQILENNEVGTGKVDNVDKSWVDAIENLAKFEIRH